MHRRTTVLVAAFAASSLMALYTLGAGGLSGAVAADGSTALKLPGDDTSLVRKSIRIPVQDEQFYFVMPDRFDNGDESNDYGGLEPGDTDEDVLRHGHDPERKGYYHGGDIAGLIDRLDYLDDMGITSVWLTPSFENKPVQGDGTIDGSTAGYHGYWITDFTSIDPHMGTNEELEELVDRAHARGMKVYFDIITNHTADVIYYEDAVFEDGRIKYISKDEVPYRDASGETFDDADFAGTDDFPELDAQTSFPYTPVVSDEEEDVKVPEWLNDRTYYHNRGDTDFQNEDEDQLYGDFVGLDDLFTEHPDVVDGMVDIYKEWVDYGVDGFRIDTVKHVNTEFWQEFSPEVLAHAKENGNDDFFMFGEVFSTDKEFTSKYTTEARLQAILDFPFQDTARKFASQGTPTDELRTFFEDDDYYTDADSNAYSLPTFLGNHDMGRFGYFIEQDNPAAEDDEVLRRDLLGHELMFFSRGMPVVYYGDEQGFTGGAPGNDQLARQDMFPSQTPEYQDDENIGSDETPASDNFDRDHPIYQSIQDLADVRQDHLALRRGAQIHRFSSSEAGIYAFSRINRTNFVEYVVASNNSTDQKTAAFDTFSDDTRFVPVYGEGATVKTNGSGRMTVRVDGLSTVVYKAVRPVKKSQTAPAIRLNRIGENGRVEDRFEVSARLSRDAFSEVTFAVRKATGPKTKFVPAGTDDNAPYRIFYDASDIEPGTKLEIKAIVSDLNGHTRSSPVTRVTVG